MSAYSLFYYLIKNYHYPFFFFFFFNDTATTEIYTLSLHDALPISTPAKTASTSTSSFLLESLGCGTARVALSRRDRKSTRLNSSHGYISYAVFCLKKKKKKKPPIVSTIILLYHHTLIL